MQTVLETYQLSRENFVHRSKGRRSLTLKVRRPGRFFSDFLDRRTLKSDDKIIAKLCTLTLDRPTKFDLWYGSLEVRPGEEAWADLEWCLDKSIFAVSAYFYDFMQQKGRCDSLCLTVTGENCVIQVRL